MGESSSGTFSGGGVSRTRIVDFQTFLKEKHGISLGISTIWDHLQKLGCSWKSGRHRHPKSKKTLQETFKKTSSRKRRRFRRLIRINGLKSGFRMKLESVSRDDSLGPGEYGGRDSGFSRISGLLTLTCMGRFVRIGSWEKPSLLIQSVKRPWNSIFRR